MGSSRWKMFVLILSCCEPCATSGGESLQEDLMRVGRRSEIFHGASGVFVPHISLGDKSLHFSTSWARVADAAGLTSAFGSDVPHLSGRHVILCVGFELEDCPLEEDVLKNHTLVADNSVESVERLRTSRYDSLVYLVDRGPEHDLAIYEIYSIGKKRLLQRYASDISTLFVGRTKSKVSLVERWHGDSQLFKADYVWARRSDLQGEKLTVFMIQNPPFTVVLNATSGLLSGYNVEVVKEIIRRMNFTFEVKMFVKEKGRDIWEQLMNDLEAGLIDMSFSFLYRLADRLERCSLSRVVYKPTMVLVTRKNLLTTEGSSLTSMFRVEVWLLGGITILALMTWGYVILRAESTLLGLNSSLAESMEFLGAMTAQGSTLSMCRVSKKILLLTALMFGILSVSSLSARLISTLSIQRTESLVKSLDDVLALRLPLYIANGGHTELNFRDAPASTVRHKLWKSGQVIPLVVYEEEEVMRKFLRVKDRAALVIHEITYRHFIKSRRDVGCQLAAHGLKGKTHVGIPFRRDFPYLRTVEYHLVKMRDSGLLKRLYEEWFLSGMTKDYLCSVDGISR